MSQPTDEERGNNLIAAGALMAVLLSDHRVEVTQVEGNTLMVTFPFLQSPYMVTVERWKRNPVGDLDRRRARDCQTCNGPRSRETKGLVCQTCGWDYGKDGEP